MGSNVWPILMQQCLMPLRFRRPLGGCPSRLNLQPWSKLVCCVPIGSGTRAAEGGCALQLGSHDASWAALPLHKCFLTLPYTTHRVLLMTFIMHMGQYREAELLVTSTVLTVDSGAE